MSNEITSKVDFGDFSVLIPVYGKSDPKQLEEAISSVWYDQVLKPGQLCVVIDGL